MQIDRVTRLAEARAVQHAGAPFAALSLPYQWPTRPRITQPYGCTGFILEPARGSCAHFHDGIDLGPGYGARVGAAADGVVAYVGWGPSKDEDRAFIVVIAHADGNRTLYGHLVPDERVHAGQWVAAGETIGFVGDTGRSTGAHLHLEVSRDGRTIDPVTLIDPGAEPVEVVTDDPVTDDAAVEPATLDAVPPSPLPDPAPLDTTGVPAPATYRGQ